MKEKQSIIKFLILAVILAVALTARLCHWCHENGGPDRRLDPQPEGYPASGGHGGRGAAGGVGGGVSS